MRIQLAAALGTLTGTLLLTGPGLAQDEEAPQGPPGCEDYAGYGDFDFWAGEWNVYGRDGSFGGQNYITKRSGGCLIVEEWFSAGGGNGTSMNYVDPASGGWRQIWMSANTYIDYTGGLNENGQMMLDGQITYFREDSSRSAAFRGVWTPLANGHVIQHFQEYDADSDDWQDWFVATYVPMADDPNGEEPAGDAAGPVIESPPAFAFED